jgi:hypothetical protein
MIEAYTTEEVINYYTRYVWDENAIGLPIHQHESRTMRMGCTGRKVRTDIENKIMQDAHHGTLNQLVSMEKWVE